MTLRHMQIFTTVCDSNSVTAAAETLGVAQPAVSLAIKELEDFYGVRLFDRISHKLYLTEQGEELLRYSRQIISLFDAAECSIKNWDSFGLLRVGSSVTVGTCLMPGYVKRFHSMYPKIKVQVAIDNSAVIEKKVLENRLDFALIEGIVHSDRIIAQKFLRDELVLVCGANSAFSKEAEVSPDELTGLPFLLREKGSGTRELFDSTLLSKGIAVTPEWESISTEAIIQAVSCGLGVSVLPFRLVEQELARKRLNTMEIRGLDFKRYFSVIYHKDKHLSKSASAFLRMIRQKRNL